MEKRKIIALLLILALAFTCLAGCGKTKEVKETGREARIANNELIVAIGDEPETGFDSTTGSHGSITKVFFSTLFKRDKQLGWTNDLATGYQVSPDKLTWTITLRDDAKFTDGTNVKAEDVAYTYQTAKDAGSDIDLTMIDTITAVDDTTV